MDCQTNKSDFIGCCKANVKHSTEQGFNFSSKAIGIIIAKAQAKKTFVSKKLTILLT